MRRAVLLLGLGGCAVPCGEVGRAVADKTLSCGGASSTAIGRARALEYQFTCPHEQGWWDGFSMPRACAAAIGRLSCQEARAFGDDLDAWLSADPSCSKLAPTDWASPDPAPTETTLPPTPWTRAPRSTTCRARCGAARRPS
ncbi:MAG: hypothetical protein R3F59_38640 [Myxococcota bacterium]